MCKNLVFSLQVPLETIADNQWNNIREKDVLKVLTRNQVGGPANRNMERLYSFEQKLTPFTEVSAVE